MENNKKLNYFVSILIIVGSLWAFSGCASGWLVEYKPGQIEATAMVVESFGTPGFVPAPIKWRERKDLNCKKVWAADGKTVIDKVVPWEEADGWLREGKCVKGYHMGQHEVEIKGVLEFGGSHTELAWYDSSIVDTSIVHEICHNYTAIVLGNIFENHDGPCFGAGGLVEVAQTALASP